MFFIFSKGLRAKLGAGYSRMNDLTIIQTTQVSIHVWEYQRQHTIVQ